VGFASLYESKTTFKTKRAVLLEQGASVKVDSTKISSLTERGDVTAISRFVPVKGSLDLD